MTQQPYSGGAFIAGGPAWTGGAAGFPENVSIATSGGVWESSDSERVAGDFTWKKGCWKSVFPNAPFRLINYRCSQKGSNETCYLLIVIEEVVNVEDPLTGVVFPAHVANRPWWFTFNCGTGGGFRIATAEDGSQRITIINCDSAMRLSDRTAAELFDLIHDLTDPPPPAPRRRVVTPHWLDPGLGQPA